MAGPQELRLQQALGGAKPELIDADAKEWEACAILLNNIADDLANARMPVEPGELGHLTAEAMHQAFDKSAAGMRKRAQHLTDGGTALANAAMAVYAAEAVRQGQSEAPKAPVATKHPDPGSEEALRAEAKDRADQKAYERAVADREEAFRKAADQLDLTYDASAETMKKIHGVPDPEQPPTTPGGNQPGPGGRTPPGGGSTPTVHVGGGGGGGGTGNGGGGGGGGGSTEVTVPEVIEPPTPVTPHPPVGGGGGGGGALGPGDTPLTPGPGAGGPGALGSPTPGASAGGLGAGAAAGAAGIGAGALAAGGLRGGPTAVPTGSAGSPTGRSAGAGSARQIGAGGRAGTSGALGRGTGPVAGTGQAGSRAAGGAAKAGGRRAGAAAGAGKAGSRAAAAAGAGGRSGKAKDREAQRQGSEFTEDWVDEIEDAAPQVLE